MVDWTNILTKEKIDALFEKIAHGLEKDHVTGSHNMIVFAIKEAWIAGFEAGRRPPLNTSEDVN